MNILFLMGIYPSFGGVEKVSTVLSNEFVRRGHTVSIVSFEQPYPELAVKELEENIELYKLDFPVYKKSNLERLRGIILKKDIDVLINQWAVPFYVARLCRKAIRGTNAKLITVHHNIPNTNARIKDIEIALSQKKDVAILNQLKLFIVRTISRLSLRAVYSMSDRYIVLSDSFKDIAAKFIFRKKLTNIQALPNPITISTDHNSEGMKKSDEIIYVGRLEYNQKRCFRILDIWKQLQHEYQDWKLIIVGDGPDRADMEKRIIDLGLERVKITGFTNPEIYYKSARILILVSEYEGMPLVLAESMSFGVIPVVLDTFPSTHDLIPNNNVGVLIKPPYKAELFKSEMTKLMSDRARLDLMSKYAIKYSEKYSLSNIVENWEKMFDELVID